MSEQNWNTRSPVKGGREAISAVNGNPPLPARKRGQSAIDALLSRKEANIYGAPVS